MRFLRRLCAHRIRTVYEADVQLFRRVMNNKNHILQPFLHLRVEHSYNPRRRHHDLQLSCKNAYSNDKCFITRMLHGDSYQHLELYCTFLSIVTLLCFVNLLLNEYNDDDEDDHNFVILFILQTFCQCANSRVPLVASAMILDSAFVNRAISGRIVNTVVYYQRTPILPLDEAAELL